MSITELKQELFYKLTAITDENLLNQVHVLLNEIKIDVKPYVINNKQIEMINESESDYLADRIHSNDSIFKEDDK
jgi:Txe/YoeB family toxin of Txe-Axe toxin-antitoxin module